MVATQEELKKVTQGHQRQLSKLKDSDTVFDCLPETTFPYCRSVGIALHENPFYRHQVHEMPKPRIDITEDPLFLGQCRHCNEIIRAKRPEHVPQGIMGPNLLSHIALLSGQYHLSI